MEGINVHEPKNLRYVPDAFHTEITTLQNAWWDSKMEELEFKGSGRRKPGRADFWTDIKNMSKRDQKKLWGEYKEFCESLDGVFSDVYLKHTATAADVQKMVTTLDFENWDGLLKSLRHKRWGRAFNAFALHGGKNLVGMMDKFGLANPQSGKWRKFLSLLNDANAEKAKKMRFARYFGTLLGLAAVFNVAKDVHGMEDTEEFQRLVGASRRVAMTKMQGRPPSKAQLGELRDRIDDLLKMVGEDIDAVNALRYWYYLDLEIQIQGLR